MPFDGGQTWARPYVGCPLPQSEFTGSILKVPHPSRFCTPSRSGPVIRFVLGTGEAGAADTGTGLQQGFHVVPGHWWGEVEALAGVAAEPGHGVVLFGGFDAFGDDAHVQGVGELDDGGDDDFS